MYFYVINGTGNAFELEAFWQDILFDKDGNSLIRLGQGNKKVEIEVEKLNASSVSFENEEDGVPEEYFRSLSVRHPKILLSIVCDEADVGERICRVYIGGKEQNRFFDFAWLRDYDGPVETSNQRLAERFSRENAYLLKAS